MNICIYKIYLVQGFLDKNARRCDGVQRTISYYFLKSIDGEQFLKTISGLLVVNLKGFQRG